ncbi:MAG: flagellar biosynthesis regulator FlaF [Desulfobacterales bacterium]|nr:flagellar biosynthesis regulator FlaF [Desulfobacterales bacterium]
MPVNPYDSYKTVDKASLSGRELEAAVLTEAALKLKSVQDNWNAPDRKETLDAALKYNQLLWSIFQGELMDKNNPLPKKLREDLLSLSAFVDKRIFEVMSYPSAEKLSILIDINKNIAAGLRTNTFK